MEDNKTIERMKVDFKNFLFVIWHLLGLPDPTPAQYVLADYLQYGPKRKILEAFRGIGKSWITSAYVVWRLWKDPDYKFLVVSASKQRADDFSTFTKRLISDNSFLAHLKPAANQRDSVIAFDVGPAKPAHAPSVKSVGIFGQLTGSRATEIIADDVEVSNNSATQDMREKLIRAVLEFEAIIVPGGGITYLGTPQTEESIYNKLSQKGYKPLIIPAKYPRLSDCGKYCGNLAEFIETAVQMDPSLIGHSVDPLRFTDMDLMEREASYGRSGFALQFMLDTSLSDAEKYPLKTSDLIISPVHIEKAPVSIAWASGPDQVIKEIQNVGFTGDKWYRPLFIDKDWAPYEGAVMSIDPSGRGQDETGYAVGKHLHGTVYVPAAGGLKGGYDDTTLKRLAEIARDNKVNRIIIEANFGDGMFTKIFTPILASIYPCTLEEVKHSTQKERRIIDTLEPVMNRHRLVFDPKVVQDDLKSATKDNGDIDLNYSLFYQMTRLTKERGSLKHDDRLDALAIMVAYWTDAMARDEDRAAKEYRSSLVDKELERFSEHVFGHKPSSPNWLTW